MAKGKKNFTFYIFIAIFCILVLGLGSYFVYDKIIGKEEIESLDRQENTEIKDNQDNGVNEEEIESLDRQENTEIKDNQDNGVNEFFLIVDSPRDDYPNYKSTLYLASNTYFKDGTKKKLFTKNILSMSVFKNKIFYIDDSQKMYVYNVNNQTEETYDLGGAEINYLTTILPGEKNVVVNLTDGNVIVINLINKTHYMVNLNDNRGDGIFDDKNSILYYSIDNNIYQYNISNRISSIVEGLAGFPIFQDNKYVYFEGETAGKEYFFSLNKETKKIEKLNINDYAEYTEAMSLFAKINDNLFLLSNYYDKLIQYKDAKETYVFEVETYEKEIKFVNIADTLYVAEFLIDLECEFDCDRPNAVYTYDINNSKLETANNDFIKELFNYYNVYNLYE